MKKHFTTHKTPISEEKALCGGYATDRAVDLPKAEKATMDVKAQDVARTSGAQKEKMSKDAMVRDSIERVTELWKHYGMRGAKSKMERYKAEKGDEVEESTMKFAMILSQQAPEKMRTEDKQGSEGFDLLLAADYLGLDCPEHSREKAGADLSTDDAVYEVKRSTFWPISEVFAKGCEQLCQSAKKRHLILIVDSTHGVGFEKERVNLLMMTLDMEINIHFIVINHLPREHFREIPFAPQLSEEEKICKAADRGKIPPQLKGRIRMYVKHGEVHPDLACYCSQEGIDVDELAARWKKEAAANRAKKACGEQ